MARKIFSTYLCYLDFQLGCVVAVVVVVACYCCRHLFFPVVEFAVAVIVVVRLAVVLPTQHHSRARG